MCDTTGNHSHAHGVRSALEKSLGDLRTDLGEKLQTITKIEAQIAVISDADFPQAGEVVHVLTHIKNDEKKHAKNLMNLLNKLDTEPSNGDKEKHSHDHSKEGHSHAH